MRKLVIGLVCCVLGVASAACGGKVVPLGTTGAGAGGGGSGGSSTGGGAGASVGAAAGGGGAAGAGGAAGQGGAGGVIDDPVQEKSSKLDVLLVIDNSYGMPAWQALFRRSVGDLIRRLANPLCLDAQGNAGSPQPTAADQPCPTGTTREFPPVRDMNIGVISSSLGGHGGDNCSPEEGSTYSPRKNDSGHLLASVTTAPGAVDAGEITRVIEANISEVGSNGCGFEAPLEAAYRFLVDPEPPLSVSRDPANPNRAIVQGVDPVVILQRRDFLRNDSAVLVVILSDENDCSIMDGGVNWLPTQAVFGGVEFRLPRATSTCATDPNSPCCRSCGLDESNGPPSGCTPQGSDPACAQGNLDILNDSINLRCWKQRERFGLDFLHSIDRYVQGFALPTVQNRNDETVVNPLFAHGRHPSLVSVAAIVGVPWQDLARSLTGDRLEFLAASELRDLNRWPIIVGNPSRHVPPADPYMHEEVEPRSGTNPITGDPIAPPGATGSPSPINGRDVQIPDRHFLQASCITALPEPFDCAVNPPPASCYCVSAEDAPWCMGTTQTHSRAFPGIRELELMRRLGPRGVTASICSRNVTDESRQDFGHRPAMQAILERMKLVLR